VDSENVKKCCKFCARYDLKNSFCRDEKRTKRRDEFCYMFKVRLADHYVPNIWDEWKHKAERDVRL